MTFQILEGVDRGRVFKDLPIPVTIGREEGNGLRLDDQRVSRFHAKVQMEDGDIILTDLDSTNGTRVNGMAVQIRRIRPGDQISIGRTVLLFGTLEELARRSTPIVSDPLWDGVTPPGAEKIRVFRNTTSTGVGLTTRCEGIRAALESGSLFCTEAESDGLMDSVLDPQSTALQILGRGFHRVVVANAARKVDEHSNGSAQARFLVEVCRAVGAAFSLNLDSHRFHPEDVFQILKDEPPSLFCFAHFERVPSECFPIARAFTQSQHRALFLNEGSRQLAVEEHNHRAVGTESDDSAIADAVSGVSGGQTLPGIPLSLWSTSEEIPPLPQLLTPAQTARLAEIIDYLHRGLTSGTEQLAAVEDGTKVRFGLAEWQTIQTVQFLLARYGRLIMEP